MFDLKAFYNIYKKINRVTAQNRLNLKLLSIKR